MIAHPIYHWMKYGESGSGKSTSSATWPKPMLVFAFDPIGKEAPYLKRGEPGPLEYRDDGTAIRGVFNAKGNLIIQIEHYIDPDPRVANAYLRFLKRVGDLQAEYESWKTVVVDSATFMELAARKWYQYILNPNTKEPRQWYASSTEALEEMLMIRFGSMPLNVVVNCHIDEDKDEAHGFFVRNPAFPGRLRKRAASGYSELYREYVAFDEEGKRQYLWQTEGDGFFQASTQLGAPNPCKPVYSALFPEQVKATKSQKKGGE